ncbi:MAG TPA: ribosome biogenesis GTP-binding protein YihA/YsxC [Bacteroidia bacterium]|nr:ribosome biogenesis GTP-binding protein YihA/YsxC [Bacteroidia bacterium]
MKISSAVYLQSCVKVEECPLADRPEFAFIGRSNVGKSSLLNMLTNKPGLAKVSNRPGKTQVINHFEINKEWYLVDLPGYGYARVSKKMREGFDQMISAYITKRKNLLSLFVLLDIRIPPQEIDMEFIRNLGKNEITFSVIFTKCDKLGKQTINKNLENYKKALLEDWEEMPNHFLSSAETKAGRKEILDFVKESMKYFDI